MEAGYYWVKQREFMAWEVAYFEPVTATYTMPGGGDIYENELYCIDNEKLNPPSPFSHSLILTFSNSHVLAR